MIDETTSVPSKKRTAKAKKKAAKSSGKQAKTSKAAKNDSPVVGRIDSAMDTASEDDDGPLYPDESFIVGDESGDDASPNPYAPPQLDDSAAIDEDDEAAHTPEDE